MKVCILCDKFKGSLTSTQVNDCLEKGIKQILKSAEIKTMPMADGGEGTSELLMTCKNLTEKKIDTIDALGRNIQTTYLVDDKGQVYVESAKICGLSGLSESERNPSLTHSGGLGIVIRKLLEKGVKTFHLFLGGSATNDGGAGMVKELGFMFYDDNEQEMNPAGGNLIHISRIENKMEFTNEAIDLKVWVDTQIQLTGDAGATRMYASQKGALKQDVELLEKGMLHLTNIVARDMKKDKDQYLPGSGAAGGTAYGCLALLNAKTDSATSFLFRLADVENLIKKCDVVITGEGSLDHQTLTGKLVAQIAALANKHNKPCIAVCGQNKLSVEESLGLGISKVYSIVSRQPDLTLAISQAADYITGIGNDIAKEYQITGKKG